MSSVIDLIVRHGYAVVFGWVLAEQLGLPLPAVPFLLAAGALIEGGKLDPVRVLIAGAGASLISDTVWYYIGRFGGMRVLGWLCRIAIQPDSCVRKTQISFGNNGARSLLIAKFVPGLNTAAPPLAGIVGMPIPKFLLYTGLGGVIWVSAWVGLGMIFSTQLEMVAAQASRLGNWALVLVIVAALAWVVAKFVSRQRFLRKIRIGRITPEDLKALLDRGETMMVVDLRDRLDFETDPSMIPGSLHLTTEELEARHQEIPREQDIVLYCT